ncbi:TPA: hypothetical protein ACH3X3_013095 [Trebouxia sp. C0006]
MLQQFLAVAARGRRVPRKGFTALNSKRGPRTFYKGKGAEPTGHHTRKGKTLLEMHQLAADITPGGYQLLKDKLPEYIVPDLKGFALKPYVSRASTKAE